MLETVWGRCSSSSSGCSSGNGVVTTAVVVVVGGGGGGGGVMDLMAPAPASNCSYRGPFGFFFNVYLSTVVWTTKIPDLE